MQDITDYGLMAWLEIEKGIEPVKKEKVRPGVMKSYYDYTDDEWMKLREQYQKSKYFPFVLKMTAFKNLTH